MEKPDISRSAFLFPIRRPVTVVMIVLTCVVFGLLSYRLLPINIMPNISYPSLTVRTEYPGSAPEEVESIVTRPLEQSLGIVRHLVEMTSSSRVEYSEVLLEFDWGTDMTQATQDVREKLDHVFLPEDVKQPLILRYDPSLDPLMRIGLTSDSLSLMNLRKLVDEYVQQEIEKLPGVAAVKIKGGREEEVRIAIDPLLLDRYNISIEQVSQRLAGENINVAGGLIREGEAEFLLRTLNEYASIDQIAATVISYNSGIEVRLRDVAQVFSTAKDKTVLTRVGERESVVLEVFKESDANPINVSELVKQRFFGWESNKKQPGKKNDGKDEPKGGLRPLSDVLGKHVSINVLADQAEFIKFAVDEVKSSALIGGILAVIILLLFLGSLKDTIVVALVIPVSLISAFAAMHLTKVSINIMSLGGLALGIGMMVDNAIVVIESIHRRREQGLEAIEAAVSGTSIVGAAVIASTLTTVVVFFPIVFVTGIAGQVFGDMALTVIISLTASLIMALFFIPMLVSRTMKTETDEVDSAEWTKPSHGLLKAFKNLAAGFRSYNKHSRKFFRVMFYPFVSVYFVVRCLIEFALSLFQWFYYLVLTVMRFLFLRYFQPVLRYFGSTGGRGISLFGRFIHNLTNQYVRILAKLLRKTALVPLVFLLIFVISIFGILPRIGRELIPSFSQGTFLVEITLPVGTPLERSADVIYPLEKLIKTMPDVREVSSRVGGDLSAGDESSHGSNFAQITVKLNPGGNLENKENVIIDRIRDWAGSVPALEMRITHPTLFSFKSPIEIIIKGDNLDWVKQTTRAAESLLGNSSHFTDIKSSVQSGFPEAVIRFDRDRLAMLNITARTAAERIKTAIHGSIPTKFREDEQRIDMRLQWMESERRTLEQLRDLVINPEQAVPVTLKEIADITVQEGPAEIRHFRNIRSGVITANIKGIDLESATGEIQDTLEKLNLRQGFDYILTGQQREMDESTNSLQWAMLLAMFLVYVVMASQFESFKSPFLILFTVPFAISGVIPALWFFGIPLSVMVFLGMIVLVGIVVNNSIVLVDYTNQLTAKGYSTLDAILEAARARFRPILMTSLTTILALVPMAIGVGEGVEIRRPMAVTVIFGLMYSTLVSLIVIPALYKMLTRSVKPKPAEMEH